MNKKPIVKYIRVEGTKIIIIPTAEGRPLISKLMVTSDQFQPLVESIEKVGKIEVFAYTLQTFTDIQYWKVEHYLNEDRVEYYFYTIEQERVGFSLPYFVAEAKVL